MNKFVIIMCSCFIALEIFGIGFIMGARQKCENVFERPEPIVKWRDTCFVPNHPAPAPLKSKSQ